MDLYPMPDDPQLCADCGEEMPACLCATEVQTVLCRGCQKVTITDVDNFLCDECHDKRDMTLCEQCHTRPHTRTTGPDHPMYAETWYWCDDCQDTARERQDAKSFADYYAGSSNTADYALNHAQQQAKENK